MVEKELQEDVGQLACKQKKVKIEGIDRRLTGMVEIEINGGGDQKHGKCMVSVTCCGNKNIE